MAVLRLSTIENPYYSQVQLSPSSPGTLLDYQIYEWSTGDVHKLPDNVFDSYKYTVM